MVKKFRAYYLLWSLLFLPAAWWFWLPDPLFQTPYSTVILDRNKDLLGARPAADGQWRFPGDDLVVPHTFASCIVTFEDKRFYDHPGIDFLALTRAMRDNIKSGSVKSGGSTLTMQTMRLARGNRNRNIWQKCIEMMWAWRAEIRYSKKEILRLYASHAPFGGNVVGLGAASWRYFHKTPEQLSWAEAATLAVLPNSPALIHTGRNRETLLHRRNKLIEQLVLSGKIDSTEASLALMEPLPDHPHPLPDIVPHLMGQHKDAGATLQTTIDAGLQLRLTELLQRHADIMELNGVNNAALLVMETGTGAVRAYIGNAHDEQRKHHNDVDMITAERSSGSILKPFLYCAALEDGFITPKGIVEDIPTFISGYQPLNFSEEYMGMVAADQALAMSLNVPAVRMLQQYGILPFKEKLEAAGITTLHFTPEHYGLPLVLGGAEVTLWDVCGAYASMGRVLGNYYRNEYQYSRSDIHPPYILNQDLAKSEESGLQEYPPVWNAGAVWQTFEAMSTLRRPDQEGQWETFNSSRRIAWKTGTSFGYRDAWAVGLTPQYTIGVWVGNADGEGRPGVIGLHAAAPVLFDVLSLLDDNSSWWDVPYHSLAQHFTCRESGWLAGEQCTITDTTFLIRGDHVPEICQYHTTVLTDANERYSYDPLCGGSETFQKKYFVVPAIAETYYRRYHPAYEALPPLHPDCRENNSIQDLAIIYPRNGSKIYVPYEWDHKRSRAVFTAVHRSDTAQVYWHLDNKFLAKTKEFHQIEIDPSPGKHELVLQDEHGSVVTAVFEVLH